MFKRRKPLTILQKAKELLWPTMGWLRMAHYSGLRVLRLSGTTEQIALGLTIGVAVSFSPIMGTHFIQAGILAFIFRANFLASLIGTVIGNPWTFPFIWWASMSFGSFLFDLAGLPASVSMPSEASFSVIWNIFQNEPSRIFLPWLVGGYLIALFLVPICYPVFYKIILSAKATHKKKREKKLHRMTKDVTGQDE